MTTPDLIQELREYLDLQPITCENIGAIRRRLLVPWESAWNGIVRDETAKREEKAMDRSPNSER